MAVSPTLPAHNQNVFQTKLSSYRSKLSPLNPVTGPRSALLANSDEVTRTRRIWAMKTESTRLHLANLDKLLQKPSVLDPQPPHQWDREEIAKPSDVALSEEEKRAGSGLLEGLSLARIWPGAKAAEEMSPRHLHRLQRLLSMTPEYSPRNSLASRWQEYHGCNDWAGLLDPLDENLRREVVRYGEFVQAAYEAFNTDPATSAEVAPPPRHVVLPDRSYKVTKSLYATSSIGLPKWVDDVAPDLDWMTQRSSWIGYVAVCEDRREIQRMGRRDIVIALRGTATCLEWAENMRAHLVDMPQVGGPAPEAAQGQSKVECGFQSLYRTGGAHVPSLAESVADEVKRLLKLYEGETLSITVTGHSLGAALALLVADELSTCSAESPSSSPPPHVAVFSFGGPRVGNKAFANRINAKNVKVLRIVNNQDIITRVPGTFLSEDLEQKLRDTKLEGVLDDNMPWDYSHVGTELRVDTRMSPFLKPDADVACCHDLEAYLHLVDGFSSSNCPFRDNAKRSLVRLLNEQASNVKRLYTSKAKALRLNIESRRNHQGMPMSNCLPSPS
ncbi:phospholipase A1-Ibeta2, chloroplastic-like [Syzygium oleosum]|uniref:phospholipase A1-Ibeta2, chloroplastic-like n=1 Tax=Syzygium oleosum TaxID=219896 RepID=UPI0024B8FB97|nr:phospholipase A1-Ibeta2, chloroplastic-like [Syzygium oleosum]XP_056160426.1 phospholipase A1-Ibeta2, chloroplastic-like [Syzygium oleosum]XP_056160427.1 phospholipase A1-Ibeta2, chloroplastic-like [Syzygium oleosum]XP_056160428.1 phospholipase A1-Ibeta2, chloroplastic-like [Syzygium oleosum]XP_056160429.1 phospholipase A1-Ibeta2, chloroplastic-like [Syzygium oleosum]XP_056160430.1 phospholipase A1-Ibeta2, chloroplastic-like [Syzygium oleosum]XP_056160431.1 phospholipase A1-Ibeta2, chlorop